MTSFWVSGRGQAKATAAWLVMVVIPPIAKCAMDGAPVDCRLMEENRQRQRLLGGVMVVIPPIAKCAMDGAPVDCRLVEENRQRHGRRRVGLGTDVAEKRLSSDSRLAQCVSSSV